MTEKMTAHLYLSSESFKYNGTDSDDAIKNKLVLFYDLVKTLVANKNENKLLFNYTMFPSPFGVLISKSSPSYPSKFKD